MGDGTLSAVPTFGQGAPSGLVALGALKRGSGQVVSASVVVSTCCYIQEHAGQSPAGHGGFWFRALQCRGGLAVPGRPLPRFGQDSFAGMALREGQMRRRLQAELLHLLRALGLPGDPGTVSREVHELWSCL